MRTLIPVAMIHAEVDLGSAAGAACSRFDGQTWSRRQQGILRYWQQVWRELDRLGLNWGRAKIYHDSLPVGGNQGLELVRTMAAQGSPDYGLVWALVARGATLLATEDPQLLLREYELVRTGRLRPREEFDRPREHPNHGHLAPCLPDRPAASPRRYRSRTRYRSGSRLPQ